MFGSNAGLNWDLDQHVGFQKTGVTSDVSAEAFLSPQSDLKQGRDMSHCLICDSSHCSTSHTLNKCLHPGGPPCRVTLITGHLPTLTVWHLVSNAVSHCDAGALQPSLKLSSKNRRGDVGCDACASVSTLVPRLDPSSCDYYYKEVKINLTPHI